MGLGDLCRVESAFVEAALWVQALEVATQETGGFGATLLPFVTTRAIPNAPVSMGHYGR